MSQKKEEPGGDIADPLDRATATTPDPNLQPAVEKTQEPGGETKVERKEKE